MHRQMRTEKRGQSVIEFVFVLAIILTVLYGTVDLVRMGVARHVLDSACREGARVAATLPDLQSNNAIIISRVNKILMDTNLIDDVVTTPQIVLPQSPAQKGDIITITVSIQYTNIFSIISGDPKTISGKGTSKYLL